MTTQPEALQLLIEDLELNHEFCPKEVILQAAAELRRLHEVNQELLEALKLAEDALLYGANMNAHVVRRKIYDAIAKATGGAV